MFNYPAFHVIIKWPDGTKICTFQEVLSSTPVELVTLEGPSSPNHIEILQ